MPKALERIGTDFSLWRCHHCGQCSSVCPSGKHGGIQVSEIMSRVTTGSLDLGSEKSLWLCTMCQSCSERCEAEVDPGEVITILRNACAESGNCPQYFKEEARRYLETGLSFPKSGLTRKMRNELGLEDHIVDAKALEETRTIAKKTRLGRMRNES